MVSVVVTPRRIADRIPAVSSEVSRPVREAVDPNGFPNTLASERIGVCEGLGRFPIRGFNDEKTSDHRFTIGTQERPA